MVGPPPLQGLKVLEFAGLAPGPFAGMLLADAGADVLRIDRPIAEAGGNKRPPPPTPDMLARHKRSITVDLKSAAGIQLIKALARTADVLVEPFRPGVMERLGLGPDVLLCEGGNPRLVYARMAGFRRDGRYAAMAGHDINYLAVSGALSLLGRAGQAPHPPTNILGDFAGGGAMLVLGVLMALVARDRPDRSDSEGGGSKGKGQVVEANMVDGASYLATFPRLGLKTPAGDGPRGTNLLDGGCPFYDTYETRDDGSGSGGETKQYMAVGALEPQFFRALVKGLGLEGKGLVWVDDERRRHDRKCWPEMRRRFEMAFRERTRDEWEAVFDGSDACCTPVLGYGELEAAAAAKAGDEGGGSGTARREGDQRPPVTLRGTPLLAIAESADTAVAGGISGRGSGSGSGSGRGENGEAKNTTTTTDSVVRGQGPGVPGGGYVGTVLAPGQGGEEALAEWLGWKRGTHFEVEEGGLVLLTEAEIKAKARL